LKVEDNFSIYGVYDGHGHKGHEVSNFVKDNLPKLIIRDQRFKTKDMCPMLFDAFKRTQSLISTMDRTKKLNSELANGRLAMMAIIGMFYQDGLTGSAWGDWANYVDSPLRAFENELGVQAPVGYFDPLGFAKDGDADEFKRRREVELKNGRVAMFATLGYIVPEYFRWPGMLSPSEEVTFASVPNGLGAFSAVPFLGWVQIVVFCGLVDFGLYRADPSRDPGDYENAGILGVPNASGPMSDVEGRKRKLNSELANGRLAMFAIMGMMFQNGVTGTTGPEMWTP